MIYDFIIAGSGPSGSQAAQTLVESGLKVAMLDVGFTDDYYKKIIPEKDFVSIRREEEEQHTYFLGKDFEGIPWGKIKVGSQLTPPRKFITEEVNKWIPMDSDSFTPMESLAYGGLGSGWGTGCHVFSNADLNSIGLESNSLNDAYETVAKRIIISGEKDDVNPYCMGEINSYQPALETEAAGKKILATYQRKKNVLNKNGFYVGKLSLAVVTKDLNERKKMSYRDMDFWSDSERSAYRPWITIDELRKKDNFDYHKNCLVIKFDEEDALVTVSVIRTDTNEIQKFQCKKFILACGTLGTARVVLRSFNYKKNKLPVISNPYCYMPCIQLNMLGQAVQQKKSSLGQVIMFYDKDKTNFDVGMGAMFSYRSLLLFKLIKEAPLDFADARFIMQFLQSSFLITGIHHPERPGENKFVQLVPHADSPTGDKLKAVYKISDEQNKNILLREKEFRWALRKLGCYPVKNIYPGNGSSIHYAGTLPFSGEEKLFSLSPKGKLRGAKNVYVADSSGFNYLPAKGLTLTLMANAHCVAQNALQPNG